MREDRFFNDENIPLKFIFISISMSRICVIKLLVTGFFLQTLSNIIVVLLIGIPIANKTDGMQP